MCWSDLKAPFIIHESRAEMSSDVLGRVCTVHLSMHTHTRVIDLRGDSGYHFAQPWDNVLLLYVLLWKQQPISAVVSMRLFCQYIMFIIMYFQGHSPSFSSQPSLSGLKKVCVRSLPSSSGILKGSFLMLSYRFYNEDRGLWIDAGGEITYKEGNKFLKPHWPWAGLQVSLLRH